MNIRSTIITQNQMLALAKREPVAPRSERYVDAYEAATETISRTDIRRKFLWMGGSAAAGALVGHLARPLLDRVGINPYVTTAILGNAGGMAGIIAHGWNVPRFIPTTEDRFHNAAAACAGTAVGIGLSAVIHHMGSSLAPWFGAAGGLLVGYGLHHATTGMALQHKQIGLQNEILKETTPSVDRRNLFAEDSARIEIPPRDYWLDTSLHSPGQVGDSKVVSPNLNFLQNYAEEATQGIGSAVFLKGSDAGPKPHLDEHSSQEDYKKAKVWLKAVDAERAFGSDNWRYLERNLEEWAATSDSAITRGVFSAVSSLTKSGGREQLFRELGMEPRFNRKFDHLQLTVYQMPGGTPEQPALVNLQGRRSDATFFFPDTETAKTAATAFDGKDLTKSFDRLTQDSVLNILSRPGDVEGVGIVATGPGRNCLMGQDMGNEASFRVHVAALLDKALRDMEG